MLECFATLNLQPLLQMESKLVDEAVIDMLKNLFMVAPDSTVILEMCVAVLNHQLNKKPDASVIQFWLFTNWAVALDNKSLPTMFTLLEKFFYYGDLKKDYIVIDFLKIL